MFLKKSDSITLYGIAVILMIIHHVLGFPNRFNNELIYCSPYLEINIGKFSKICVGIYAFITGYALSFNSSNSIQNNINLASTKLLNFFQKFWFVFLIFIPIGLILDKLSKSPTEYILNFWGLKSTINGEWWYIKVYVLMLLLFPLFDFAINQISLLNNNFKRKGLYVILFLFAFSLNKYIGIFVIGIYFFKFSFFDIWTNFRPLKNYPIIGPSSIILFTIILRFIKPSTTLDCLLVPLLIFSIISIKKYYHSELKVLNIFGELSIYIWLTHSFWTYHYFQPIVLYNKHSIAVLCLSTFLSYLTAYFLCKLYNLLPEKFLCIKFFNNHVQLIYTWFLILFLVDFLFSKAKKLLLLLS